MCIGRSSYGTRIKEPTLRRAYEDLCSGIALFLTKTDRLSSLTIFDLHIIRRLVTGYVLLVIALIVFFILLHYLEYIDDFLDRGATMEDIFLHYYPSYVPDIVRLISPLALFMACVYLTGKLAQSLQLVALQTSGVSLFRLLRPYVLVALTITAFMTWFNGWIVPKTNQTVLAFEQQHLKDAPRQVDINDIHRQNSPGTIVTVGFYDRRMQTAHRVSLQRFDGGNRLIERIDAPRMQWLDSLSLWRVEEASIRTFTTDWQEHLRYADHLDTLLNVLPHNLARTERDVESMTIPAAAQYVDELRRSGAGNTGQSLVGYYTKYAYPFANLILVLIGVPLAAVRRRGGQAIQLGLGLFTAFIYLATQKLTEPFGYSGELPPLLTAWLPHIVFFGVAIIMLWRARR